MGFEAYRQGTFTKRLADLADQPNMQAHELKAYFDSSPGGAAAVIQPTVQCAG